MRLRANASPERARALTLTPGEERALDALGDAVIVTDLAGVIAFFSRGAEALYGWSREEVVGRNVVDVTPTGTTREEAARIMRTLAAGETFHGDFAVRRKDGTSFLVHVSDSPWHDDAGNLVGIVGVSRPLADEDLATRHLRLLADVSATLSSSTDHASTVRDAVPVLVPALADAAAVYVDDAAGALHAVAQTDGIDAAEMAASVARAIEGARPGQRAIYVADASSWLGEPPAARRPRSAIAAPMCIEGRCVGALVLTMLHESGRGFGAADVTLAGQLAARFALAVETARLRAMSEAAARRYRALVAASSDVVWTANRDGRLDRRPSAWSAFTGQSATDALGEGWIQAIHDEDRPEAERTWRAAFAAAEPFEHEYRVRRADGSYTWVVDRGVPVLGDDGAVREWVGAVTDVSARRARETLLADDRAVYEALHRIGRALSTERDESTLLRIVVDEAMTLTGADAGFFAPEAAGDLPLRSADVRIDARLDDAVRRACGSRGVVSLLSVPVVAPSGETLGALHFGRREAASFSDVHERIAEGIAGLAGAALENARLYAQLRASEERARDADIRKDAFLAMLGHELRNPLAPIVTALEVLRMRGAEGREHEVIERQVRHLTRLVDDLLDVSRITRGKVHIRRARTALSPVLLRAVEMVSPLMEQRGHHLTTRLDADVDLDADATRLTQVFVNLLTNAAKYTPPSGHVHVETRASAGGIVVTIRDDGVGIDPDLLPRVFDPFVQSSRSLDRAEGGLGIGLAIVKNVLTMHGGTIEVRSEGRSRGTEVEVFLPAHPHGADGDEAPRPAAPEAGPRALRRRVLVVDDNEDAADLLAEALRQVGHEVAVAFDGPSALKLAQEFSPDVAVLDIGLPVMDGYELAERLRETLPHELRFVAVTGYGQATDRERSLAAGFHEHLVKPIDLAALEEAIPAQ